MVEAAVAAVVSLKVRQDDLALPRIEAVDEGQEFVRNRVRHAADLSELLVDHLPDGFGLDVALFELFDQLVMKPGHRSIDLASVGLEGPVDGLETFGLFLGEIQLVHELVHVMPESSASAVAVTPGASMHSRPDRVQVLQERFAAFSGVPVGGFAGGFAGGSGGGSGAEADEGYERHSQDDR